MDYLTILFEKNFDTYYIFLVLIGNNFLWNLGFYSNYLLQKVKKVYLTALHSIILGLLYYFAIIQFGDGIVEPKSLLNSYFLATSIYELGLKDVLEYLKLNGSKMIIDKLKGSSDSTPPQV